jgi:hypothetical protein
MTTRPCLRIQTAVPNHKYGPYSLSNEQQLKVLGWALRWESQRVDLVQHDQEALDSLVQHYGQLLLLVTPIYRLPVEILREVFYYTLEDSLSPGALMPVCRLWCNVLERMPSLWSYLELKTWTKLDSVKLILNRAGDEALDVVIHTEKDWPEIRRGEIPYEGLALAAGRASSWKTLIVNSLPKTGQLGNQAMRAYLISFFGSPMTQLHSLTVASAAESSPLFQPLLQNISTVLSMSLKVLDTTSPSALYYLLDPQRASTIFHSLTTLKARLTKLMDEPINLLPHLKHLEILEIRNVRLPIYQNDSDIPCVHTLRHLPLHAVSVQWMGGRTFPQLESCTIIHPSSRYDCLPLSVDLPICTILVFESQWIVPLRNLRAPQVRSLTIKSNEWSSLQVSQQVIHVCRLALGAVLKPQSLHLTIRWRDNVLIWVLRLLDGLQELYLYLPRPSALGWRVFQALLATPPENIIYSPKESFHGWIIGNSEWKSVICPRLRVLRFNYQRWFRKNEGSYIIPPLVAVGVSRSRTKSPLHTYILCFRAPEGEWQTVELAQGISPKSMLMSVLPSYAAARSAPDNVFGSLYEACFTGAIFSTVALPGACDSDLHQFIFPILQPYLRRLKSFKSSKQKK